MLRDSKRNATSQRPFCEAPLVNTSAAIRKCSTSTAMYLLLASTLLCLCFTSSSGAQSRYRQRILVLGGDGMLGSETVARLKLRGHDITIAHRGTWYWDSALRIKPWVKFVPCDRAKFNDCAERLGDVTQEKGMFDVVFDFSGYRSSDIKDFMLKMRSRIRRYIYISTDSVYEVCEEPSHEGPTREDDAKRPEDPKTREAYSQKDPYGSAKLDCEEVLRREHELWNIPFMIIRLPDVIGMRDNTDRFWRYLLWMRFHDIFDKPLELPKSLQNKPLSFVFAEDVANLLIVLPEYDENVYNFAYNLAFRETATLEEFLQITAKHLGVSDVKFDKSSERGTYYYPSVTRGPVDIKTAWNYLRWNPHTLDKAIRKTVQFYEYAMRSEDFKEKRKAILDSLPVPGHAMEAFKQRLKEVYGLDYDRPADVKDEL